MVEKAGHIDISKIIELGEKPTVRLHLASYFRVRKSGYEIEKVLTSHGLESVYDPARITPEINEELWRYKEAVGSFFTFLPQRLTLGHTAENIMVPVNISLSMKKSFYSEKTGEILPLTTNLGAPLIHPGSTGPQTYEIINTSSKPLNVRVSEIICFLDVNYLGNLPILTQQELSKGEFSNQKPGEIKLGNPGKDWEMKAIRGALGLS